MRSVANSVLMFFLFIPLLLQGQEDDDARFIKEIHDHTLTQAMAYDWLAALCDVGGRLAGSEAYDNAVEVVEGQLKSIRLDKVELQACKVNGWSRGEKELVRIEGDHPLTLKACALGNSIGTSEQGISAEVIEVQSLDEVDDLGKAGVEGKIVFFNRPMDPTQTRTFNAYGGAVDQRVWGASKAAEYGGLAAIVRSMTTQLDDHPHTGTLAYQDNVDKVPGLAISTNDAEVLSALIAKGKTELYVRTNCGPTSEKETHSVIGEIRGSEFPDEIILVGGHLDAWDIGRGAHDDGAGCVHSMQVLHTLKALGYKPKRTIRCVLFANEENGLAGGTEYARVSNKKGEFHLAALESDAGGFVPRGFSFDGHEEVLKPFYRKVSEWLPLLEPYGLQFTTGGSGADISPLKSQKGLLIGLRPDSQRYFDYHHTTQDVLSAVNKRELELGAAAMTSLIYLIDKYGLE